MASLRAGRRAGRASSWLFAAVVAAAPAGAQAQTSSWTHNASGNWTVASNWVGGVPVDGSDIYIIHNDAISRTITYNYTGASINFNSLTVDNTGTGTELFSQSANTFNCSNETLGDSGKGVWSFGGGT